MNGVAGASPGRFSTISRKAALSGVSSGVPLARRRARGDFEVPEGDRLADRHLQHGDARRHLVERLQHGDLMEIGLGRRRGSASVPRPQHGAHDEAAAYPRLSDLR